MQPLTTDQLRDLAYARRLAASAGSIREIRLAAGLSQADVARAAGLDYGAMCRIENGAQKPMGPKGAALGDLLKRIGDGSL